MRNITRDAANAFIAGKEFKRDNTTVSINCAGAVCMELYGNLIAIRFADGEKETKISAASWFTTTTKERLNGLPGVSVVQRKGVWFLNGNEWDGEWAEIN